MFFRSAYSTIGLPVLHRVPGSPEPGVVWHRSSTGCQHTTCGAVPYRPLNAPQQLVVFRVHAIQFVQPAELRPVLRQRTALLQAAKHSVGSDPIPKASHMPRSFSQ